jgi:uncharacterized phage protein (TIGR01671 family)
MAEEGESGMNMDRFRIRVWNKVAKQLYEPSHYALGCYLKDMPDTFEFMQCTGLKDSEGNLIYEGDVVRVKYDDERNNYISPVMWRYGAWCIYHEWRFDHETGERSCVGFGYWIPEALKRVTVLGNIYESPSLLEADKK